MKHTHYDFPEVILLEDDKGMLHYVIHSDGRSVSTNMPTKGQLVNNILTLKDWIDDYRNELPSLSDNVPFFGHGMTIIATLSKQGVIEIKPNDMKKLGKFYLGITESPSE